MVHYRFFLNQLVTHVVIFSLKRCFPSYFYIIIFMLYYSKCFIILFKQLSTIYYNSVAIYYYFFVSIVTFRCVF